MKLDRNHSEDIYMILKMHEIIKRYELLVEHLLLVSPHNDDESQLRTALLACDGNMSEVSRMLGVARATIYNKMKKYGIELEQV